MSKIDRRHQAKQRQLNKHKEHLKETSVFSGGPRRAAPRIVAVLPLCADGNAKKAVQCLNDSLDITVDDESGTYTGGSSTVSVDRFKQKLQYIPLQRDLAACMDAARVADFVVVILSADSEVDGFGETLLRSVESQGLSTLFTVVQHMDKVSGKNQQLDAMKSLKSYMNHFHPDQDKIFSLDNRQECSNLMRSLCSTTPKGVYWRDERSYMLVESVRAGQDGQAVFTGVVRGRGMKADRLVQVGDAGAFKVAKITAAPLEKRKKGDMVVDESEEVLDVPGEDQDDLAELAPDEVIPDADEMADDAVSVATSKKKGVLLDDHHYFSDEDKETKKRVPKGTSDYQAAWYLEDDAGSDDASDLEDYEMKDATESEPGNHPEDGVEGAAAPPTEMEPSEYPQSEMMLEPPEEDEDAQQLEAFRATRKDEATDDREFPDEIELHPNVLARERLARYRGLKSLKSSPWEEDEDRPFEPEDWQRLLRIEDYQASRTRASREALIGGVAAGTRVNVYIDGLGEDFLKSRGENKVTTLISLLRHENKRSVVNYVISLSSDHPTSIKSKDELVIQCGPRRFVTRPLFSQPGATPNDVHKYCRYLHPGQSAVASFIGPVTWGSVPVLFFQRTTGQPENEATTEPTNGPAPTETASQQTLVATGTSLAPSTSRVVVKRVILTGHPYHIHKKLVTIRYMFFNREDVEWFKALPLWTRRGRSGFIKEPVGTHGYFKATFDGRINPQDAVGVSLYKRVWPRESVAARGELLAVDDGEVAVEGGDEVMIE